MSTIWEPILKHYNDSIAKLTISVASGRSLWDRPCYQNMSNYDRDSKCQKLAEI